MNYKRLQQLAGIIKEQSNPDLATEIKNRPNTPEEAIENFSHQDAAEYAQILLDTYGTPDEFTETMLLWYDVEQFNRTWILDESIPHNFPSGHRDYVYSSVKIQVPAEWVGTFAKVTGSIIVDGLKGEVIARCGSIDANAVTLKFVQDAINGLVSKNPSKAKEEYGRRIKNMVLPKWFKGTD